MSVNPQELIDRVSSGTNLDMPALAKRLGLEPRTLKRIRAGEFKLSETVRLHLLDLERLYAGEPPKIGRMVRPTKGVNNVREEPAEDYGRADDEALRMVLARITSKATVGELAGHISEIASDDDLPSGLRTRVVKILSEFIPQRMSG